MHSCIRTRHNVRVSSPKLTSVLEIIPLIITIRGNVRKEGGKKPVFHLCPSRQYCFTQPSTRAELQQMSRISRTKVLNHCNESASNYTDCALTPSFRQPRSSVLTDNAHSDFCRWQTTQTPPTAWTESTHPA